MSTFISVLKVDMAAFGYVAREASGGSSGILFTAGSVWGARVKRPYNSG